MDKNVFIELMNIVTTSVKFGCDNIMYKQNRVAMGSPLGPALTNIFLGYHEELLNQKNEMKIYFRYINETFAMFEKRVLR